MKRSFLWSVLFLAILASAAVVASDSVLIKGEPNAKVGYYSPTWSPDGRTIAFVRGTGFDPRGGLPFDGSLYLARQENGMWKHKLLITHAYSPIWSSTGLLAYACGKGIMLYDPKVGKSRQIISNKPGASGYDDNPLSFSPNGRFLAFDRAHYEGGELRIYDTKRNRDLGIKLGDWFDWSPDGKYILESSVQKGYQTLPTRLLLWNLETRKWRRILRNYAVEDISWPRGGFTWVYLSDPEPDDESPADLKPPKGWGCYRLDLRTRRLTKASHGCPSDHSPDGRRYAYLTSSDSALAHDLYVGNTANWKEYVVSHQALSPANWHQRFWSMGWSPDSRSLAYVTVSGDIMIHRFD